MFFRTIDYIRRQPKAVREQYALWFAVLIVSSIGLIWLVMLPGRFANITMTESGSEPVRPFSQLLSQFADESATPAEPSVASSSAPTPIATSTAVTLELTPETLRQVASSAAATTTPARPQLRTVQIITTSEATASSSD